MFSLLIKINEFAVERDAFEYSEYKSVCVGVHVCAMMYFSSLTGR